MKDRRDFLKVFGVTSAVVATSSTARGIEPEKISDPTITPIKTDFPPIPNAKDVSYVVDGVLYSALELNAEEEFKPTFNNFFRDRKSVV